MGEPLRVLFNTEFLGTPWIRTRGYEPVDTNPLMLGWLVMLGWVVLVSIQSRSPGRVQSSQSTCNVTCTTAP